MRWDYPPLDINQVFPGLGEIIIIVIIYMIIIIIIIIIYLFIYLFILEFSNISNSLRLLYFGHVDCAANDYYNSNLLHWYYNYSSLARQ